MRGESPSMGLLRLWGYNTAPVLMFMITLLAIRFSHHLLRTHPQSYDMRLTAIGIAVGFCAVGALAKEKAVDMSRHGKISAG